MSAKRLIVTGRVQGVGYRDWTVRKARRFGVAGWVRNRSDGSVEILASGDPEAVEALIEKCRFGPPGSHVDGVAVSEADEAIDGDGFGRRPTA